MDKKAIQQAVNEMIDNQLKSNDPPETKQTLARLIADGKTKEEARKLIGQCILVELFYVYKHKAPLKDGRYKRNLLNLPNLPSNEAEEAPQG